MPPRLPCPPRLRLVRRSAGAPPCRPPFGLAAFDAGPDGEDVAVALEVHGAWPASGLGDLDTVVDQVPPADELAEGTLVVVLGEATRPGGVLRALLGRTRAPVARSLRASALLAQGYVDLGGGVDAASGADLAWGYARRG